MEQFAALRWFFPFTPPSPGVTAGAPLRSHQDPDNVSLTGGLHKKTLQEARCIGPAGAHRESAKLLSFSLCKGHRQNLNSPPD